MLGNIVVVIFALLLTHVEHTVPYNIIGIFSHQGRSHMDMFIPIMQGLAKKGHNVTVISYYPLKLNLPNYRDVVIANPEEPFKNFDVAFNLTETELDHWLRKYLTPIRLSSMANVSCAHALMDKNLHAFLKENNTFDIVMVELFNTDCFLPLSRWFKAKIIAITSCTMMPWTGFRFGIWDHPAYIPNSFLPFSNKMTLVERTVNTIITFAHQLYYNCVMLAKERQLVNDYFGHTLDNFIYNTSLLLINTHFTLNLPRPLVPNIVEIGGIHIKPPTTIPQNLEKWISEAKDGVIYFSLGSLIKTHTMKREKVNAFLNAFKRLPQRVLWKWENETLEGKPDNVMVQSWMPQFDILSHPNVKAFISHGGLLGTIEAVHSGVPIVVMPQFGDQHTNAKAIEASGGGVILRMSEVTENTLYKALKKVLSSDFQKQAKELSERFRDRPLPPMETAIYWVEYVARHKGAPFMKTGAVGMPFYQYYLLDVFGFIIAVVSLVSYLLFLVIRFICRIIIRKKTEVKVKTS